MTRPLAPAELRERLLHDRNSPFNSSQEADGEEVKLKKREETEDAETDEG